MAQTTVTAGIGLPIKIQRRVDEVEQADIAVVPTMVVDDGWAIGRHPDLVAWMRRMRAHGAILCSACTGLGLLAEPGLLEGRPATTHWAFGTTFPAGGPERRVASGRGARHRRGARGVRDAGGAASWQDLVLYLIGRFVSPVAAQAAAKFEFLMEAGILPEGELETYGMDDSRLPMSGMGPCTPG